MTDQQGGGRERIQESLAWGILLTALIRVGQVVVSLLLVRLLNPEIYGQFGLLSSVLGFAYVFSMQRFMEYTFHHWRSV